MVFLRPSNFLCGADAARRASSARHVAVVNPKTGASVLVRKELDSDAK